MNTSAVDITGKVILVTGAAGQIGTEISTSFLSQGASVVLADIAAAPLQQLYQSLTEKFGEASVLACVTDICDERSAEACVQSAVDRFGRLDVLINNAAIDAKFDKHGDEATNKRRFEYFPLDKLRHSVEVNLVGTIIMTQAACRQMLQQGHGNIINVASTYSVVSPNQNLYDFGDGNINYKPIDYIASKSFIPNFTRYVATFYAKDGIRCNAIVPHGIFNNHPQPFLDNWAKLSPMGRMCHREELNGPFTFLASDASSYMTGSVLNVDGGWTAW